MLGPRVRLPFPAGDPVSVAMRHRGAGLNPVGYETCFSPESLGGHKNGVGYGRALSPYFGLTVSQIPRGSHPVIEPLLGGRL